MRIPCLVFSLTVLATPAVAQEHQHQHAPPADDMAGMDMSEAHHGAMMTGALGPYPMTRDATGTAWQPDSASHDGVHAMAGPWMVMAHGEATLAFAVPLANHLSAEFGGLASAFGLPTALHSAYGSEPRAFMLFTRVRLD